MPSYLIYEQGSIDEGTETRIVGPFDDEEKANEVFWRHSQGGHGWDESWEYSGNIEGSVTGFRVHPATMLVDHYPRTDEGYKAALENVYWLVGYGFAPTEPKRPVPLTPAQEQERKMMAKWWGKHLEESIKRPSFFEAWAAGKRSPDN